MCNNGLIAFLAFTLLWLLSSSQMHVAGKTDQAKADLGRLTKIKAEREAVQAMKRKVCHFLVVKPTLTLSVAKAAELAAKQKAAAGLR